MKLKPGGIHACATFFGGGDRKHLYSCGAHTHTYTQMPHSATRCLHATLLGAVWFCLLRADVLEAALKARAELAPRIPQARAAVAATTATARKLRGGLMLTRVAAGMFDIGRAVRMQFTVAAAQQIVQQYEADRRAGSSEQPRRSKQQAQQPKEAKPAGRQPKPGPAAA